jgi:hypothetical protein
MNSLFGYGNLQNSLISPKVGSIGGLRVSLEPELTSYKLKIKTGEYSGDPGEYDFYIYKELEPDSEQFYALIFGLINPTNGDVEIPFTNEIYSSTSVGEFYRRNSPFSLQPVSIDATSVGEGGVYSYRVESEDKKSLNLAIERDDEGNVKFITIESEMIGEVT